DGDFIANVSVASRKDARDAVVAARGALAGWSGATAYNRGQILYRAAEMLEGRRDQFVAEVRAATGMAARPAQAEVDAAIDRWVNIAGWSDKLAAVDGSSNPVAGPYFDFTLPEPTGVVAVLAPRAAPLLGLVTVIARTIVTGNTCVVAVEDHPTVAISLAEVLATSDVPGGVVNVLTSTMAELGPTLAAHMDVNAIDLTGAGEGWAELEAAAADNLKRVVRPSPGRDWTVAPGPAEMLAFTEAKTVWHPRGM
ncbi:MAG TPA: aldehyde dehydrogenase family protein, partial [Nitriliruptoraceae bacterium]|nr:aldehyde dehydrogenase family protein [Nitriliruptoraceae bacterium]